MTVARKVVSKVDTSIVYDDGKPTPRLVVINRGENLVNADDMALLEANKLFCQHRDAGDMIVLSVGEQPPADEQPPTDEPPAPVNPRDRLPGESNAKYKARMAALDDEAAAADEDDEKALIDGRVKS